jgi:hypothetical protein
VWEQFLSAAQWKRFVERVVDEYVSTSTTTLSCVANPRGGCSCYVEAPSAVAAGWKCHQRNVIEIERRIIFIIENSLWGIIGVTHDVVLVSLAGGKQTEPWVVGSAPVPRCASPHSSVGSSISDWKEMEFLIALIRKESTIL